MSTPSLERFDTSTCRSLRQSLKRWFGRRGRTLPWRETTDPYRIWISEIMLQQTTVKAVIPYFERFLARFPTVQDLAAANGREVLQYWEGLGYYSRGRNLHAAAQVICQQHDGIFPTELAALRRLPGIGRYTAGAIRSFAFDLPAPIVEANTLRLYCRLLGYDGDPRNHAGQELLWNFAERLQPRSGAGHLNQALMELGSLVCTPNAPRCPECPVRRYCVAFADSRQHEIPRCKERPQVTQLVELTVAVNAGDRYLVRKRPDGERWGGMWDFVRFPTESVTPKEKLGKSTTARLAAETAVQLQAAGLTIHEPEIVTEIRHSVTRYRIRLICLTASHVGDPATESLGSDAESWLTISELANFPMPVTGRKFATLLGNRVRPDSSLDK